MTTAAVLLAFVAAAILLANSMVAGVFAVWWPVVLVTMAVQFYVRRAESKTLNEISTDPATQRRVQLLIKPWAETRFLRLLP